MGNCCEDKQIAEEEALEVRPGRAKQSIDEEGEVVEQQNRNRLEKIEVDAGHTVEGRQGIGHIELEEAPEWQLEPRVEPIVDAGVEGDHHQGDHARDGDVAGLLPEESREGIDPDDSVGRPN